MTDVRIKVISKKFIALKFAKISQHDVKSNSKTSQPTCQLGELAALD